MKPDDLTIGEAKQLVAMFGNQQKTNAGWVIGQNYLIRTVTMIDTGRLVAISDHELVLEDAAWIADTGRFYDALKSLKFNEIEPFPDGIVIIGRGSIIDAVPVTGDLPRSQK